MEEFPSPTDQPGSAVPEVLQQQALARAVRAQEHVEALQFPLGCNVVVQSSELSCCQCTGVVVGLSSKDGTYQVQVNRSQGDVEILTLSGGQLVAQEDNIAELPSSEENYFDTSRIAEMYEEIGLEVGLFKRNTPLEEHHNPFRKKVTKNKSRIPHLKKRARMQRSPEAKPNRKRVPEDGFQTSIDKLKSETPNSEILRKRNEVNKVCTSDSEENINFGRDVSAFTQPQTDKEESGRVNKSNKTQHQLDGEKSMKVIGIEEEQLNFDLKGLKTQSLKPRLGDSYSVKYLSSRYRELQDKVLLELSKRFFQPGIRLVGYIIIPGMENCLPDDEDAKTFQRQKYTLSIVRLEKDELGNDVIIGKHAAYTDEQAFAISCKVVDCCDVKRTPTAQETANTEAKIIKKRKAQAAAKQQQGGDSRKAETNETASKTDTVGKQTATTAAKNNTTILHKEDKSRNHRNKDLNINSKRAKQCEITGHQICDETGNCRERVVQISYADLETSCTGTIDFEKGNIRGFVYQLKEGQEGFFYNSMEATHQFNVVCECYDQNHIHRVAQLMPAKAERAIALAKWFMSSPDHILVGALNRVVWTSVFRDTVVLAEEWCATMRRQAVLLSDLHFKTIEEKQKTFDLLKSKGMLRASAHKKSDTFIRHLNIVGSAVGALHHVPQADKQRIVYDMIRLVNKEIFRLNSSFRRLDKAIRSFESRLPEDVLRSWSCKGNDSDICVICMFVLKSDQGALKLPCEHVFHQECASTWLHSNTSCPYCRSAISSPITGSETAVTSIRRTSGSASGGQRIDAESSPSKNEAGVGSSSGELGTEKDSPTVHPTEAGQPTPRPSGSNTGGSTLPDECGSSQCGNLG